MRKKEHPIVSFRWDACQHLTTFFRAEYQTKYNVKDDEIDAKDFYYLLLGQLQGAGDLIDSRENRGLVIADTNSTVTKAYYDFYLKGKDPGQDKVFDGLFSSINQKEQWDLILFVTPTGKYVDDGYRDQSMADDDSRKKLFRISRLSS